MPRKAKKNVEQVYNIRRAVNFTKTAISHNEKRLTYTELFSPITPTAKSPLHWNLQKFSKRDLIELLSALDLVMAVVDERGHPVAFKNITESFSTLFNIDLKYAYKERKEIEGRSDSFVKVLTDELK